MISGRRRFRGPMGGGAVAPGADNLLLESGDNLLLEDDSQILLE